MLHKLLYEWILLLLFIYITGHSLFCSVSNYCERISELKHSISFIDFPLQPLVSYDQEHSSRLFSTPHPPSKQHGETLQGFWFLLLLCHCHIILTDPERPRQPAAPKSYLFFSFFFLKFDFGFEAGAQLGSWRESACQGESLLLGKKKLPRDHSTFAASWLRDKTEQNGKRK